MQLYMWILGRRSWNHTTNNICKWEPPQTKCLKHGLNFSNRQNSIDNILFLLVPIQVLHTMATFWLYTADLSGPEAAILACDTAAAATKRAPIASWRCSAKQNGQLTFKPWVKNKSTLVWWMWCQMKSKSNPNLYTLIHPIYSQYISSILLDFDLYLTRTPKLFTTSQLLSAKLLQDLQGGFHQQQLIFIAGLDRRASESSENSVRGIIINHPKSSNTSFIRWLIIALVLAYYLL